MQAVTGEAGVAQSRTQPVVHNELSKVGVQTLQGAQVIVKPILKCTPAVSSASLVWKPHECAPLHTYLPASRYAGL